MQTTRPRITWKVLPMAQVAILRNIRSSAKDLDCELFYSEQNVTKMHYIYYLATDIHVVLENDAVLKGLKVVNVKILKTRCCIKRPMIG